MVFHFTMIVIDDEKSQRMVLRNEHRVHGGNRNLRVFEAAANAKNSIGVEKRRQIREL